MKNIWIFCLKIFNFSAINFSVYLNRHVFVMRYHTRPCVEGVLLICLNRSAWLTRWPPCPYMVKTPLNLLLQNQESFKAESCSRALEAQSYPSLFKWWLWCWNLTFVRRGQICVPMNWYGKNIEKTVSQNVFKTYGWNLQCMIKVANPFSYN